MTIPFKSNLTPRERELEGEIIRLREKVEVLEKTNGDIFVELTRARQTIAGYEMQEPAGMFCEYETDCYEQMGDEFPGTPLYKAPVSASQEIEELKQKLAEYEAGEDFECPNCGEVNPSTSCGSPNCGLIQEGTP